MSVLSIRFGHFVSALHELFDKVKAFSLGGVDYISKPFQEAEVFARINTHLTLRRQHQEIQAQFFDLSAHHRACVTPVNCALIMAGSLPDASSGEKPGLELPDDLSLSDAIEHLEHYYIPQTLSRHSGHKNQTADILGVDRKTLYRKLKKYEIV